MRERVSRRDGGMEEWKDGCGEGGKEEEKERERERAREREGGVDRNTEVVKKRGGERGQDVRRE